MVQAAQVLDVTPSQAIEELEATLGLSDSDLARGLAVNARTIVRWRLGQSYPQHEARQNLAVLLELSRHMQTFFATPGDGQAWLRNANRYLGGMTPAEAIRAGRPDRARAALGVMEWGIFV